MGSKSKSAARAAKAQQKWQVRRGDTFRAGQHLLACGDGRDPDLVEALLSEYSDRGATILLMDPPYCAGGHQEADRVHGTWGEIANDNLSASGYGELLAGVFRAVRPTAAYVFTDWRMIPHLQRTMEACGLPWKSMLVWDKGSPGLGGMWRTQHEIILYSTRRSAQRQRGLAAAGNVIRFPRTGNINHTTEKPLALLERLLRQELIAASASTADVVVDAMMGSGSSILAAGAAGLRAVGIELEPMWTAMALERLAAAGHQVERISLDLGRSASISCPVCGALQKLRVEESIGAPPSIARACSACRVDLAVLLEWRPRPISVLPANDDTAPAARLR